MTHRLSLLYSLLLSGILLTISTYITAADTPTASMLANTCAGCHGTNGSSVGPASPTIAGISKTYFIDTMVAYKKGERPATIMTRIAKGYSDEEIKLMADFFSKQTFVRYDQQFDAAKAKTGKDLHTKYCDKCHENAGRSAEDDAGILAGQWMPYLEEQFEEYKSGKRPMPKKMEPKIDKLSADDIKALINYYGSFQ